MGWLVDGKLCSERESSVGVVWVLVLVANRPNESLRCLPFIECASVSGFPEPISVMCIF